MQIRYRFPGLKAILKRFMSMLGLCNVTEN